jgi:hypothetical protein
VPGPGMLSPGLDEVTGEVPAALAGPQDRPTPDQFDDVVERAAMRPASAPTTAAATNE